MPLSDTSHHRFTLTCSYFDTGVTLFPHLKAKPRDQLIRDNQSTFCKFAAPPIDLSKIPNLHG